MAFLPRFDDADWLDGIDERMVEVDGKMVSAWDGLFIGMTVPTNNSRIVPEYVWRR